MSTSPYMLLYAGAVSFLVIWLTAMLPKGQRMIATSMLCFVLLAIFTKAGAQPAPVPLGVVKRAPFLSDQAPPEPVVIVPPIKAPPPPPPPDRPNMRYRPLPPGQMTCSTDPAGMVQCGPGYWHPVE